jgi:hypothetical protein
MRNNLTQKWIPEDHKTNLTEKQLKNLESDVEMWSGIASIVAIQFVIFCIVVIKYYDDILDVFCRGRGHLEYNNDGTTEGVKYKDYQPSKIRLNNKIYLADSDFKEIKQASNNDDN